VNDMLSNERLRTIARELLGQNGLSVLGLLLLWQFYTEFGEFKELQVKQQEQIAVCQQATKQTQEQLWSLVAGAGKGTQSGP